LLALATTDAVAQNAASVSGSYCGTWASGNSWQMSLQQSGSRSEFGIGQWYDIRLTDRLELRVLARSDRHVLRQGRRRRHFSRVHAHGARRSETPGFRALQPLLTDLAPTRSLPRGAA